MAKNVSRSRSRSSSSSNNSSNNTPTMLPSSFKAALLLLIAVQSTSAVPCSLCPDERSTQAAWLTVSFKDYELTCEAAEKYASHIEADSDACHALQDALALPCRCYPEDVTCPMCTKDGALPNLSTDDCQDVYRELPLMPRGSVECADAQRVAHGSGCCGTSTSVSRSPPPLNPSPCTLCADGTKPLRDVREFIYGDTTCNDLQAQTSVISNSSQVCYFIQTLGIRWCQCPSEQFKQCKLCAGDDGSDIDPPFPDNVADLDGETTCGDLHEAVSEFDDSCPTIQAKGHFLCGCPELPVLEHGSCSLCYDPMEDYTDNIFETRVKENVMVDVYCSDAAVEIFASGIDTKTCTQAQAHAALSCGCSTFPPPPEDPSCTLCPGGMDPKFPDREIDDIFTGGSVTCDTFHQLVPVLYDSSTCNSELLTSLKNYCGCPDVAVCRVCNLGDEIINPDKVVMSPTQSVTCAEVDTASSLIQLGANIGAFQQQCQAFRDNYAGDCCPGSSIEPLKFDFPSPTPSSVPKTIAAFTKEIQSGALTRLSRTIAMFITISSTTTLLIICLS